MPIYSPPEDDVEEPAAAGSPPAQAPPQPQDDTDERANANASANAKQQSASTSTDMVDSAFRFYQDNPRMRKFHELRTACGDFINHPRVQLFILFLIVVNAIIMGVATFDFVTEDPEVERIFEITDTTFLTVFTLELVLQIAYMGFGIFRDGWLVFDFLIIVPSWALDQLQIIRAFRIFRALRIITRIETMRNLVTAVFDIMPRLGAITALLLIIFYIFAVLFTNLFGDLELSGPYFTRLDHTVMTLFVFMTMEWAEVAREVMEYYWWAWLPFIVFVMVTGFITFNLIIAVVCDAVAVIEDKSKLAPWDDGAGMGGGGEEPGRGTGGEGPPRETSAADAEKRDIVDGLEARVDSLLRTQQDMLAMLELLHQRAPAPTQEGAREPGEDAAAAEG